MTGHNWLKHFALDILEGYIIVPSSPAHFPRPTGFHLLSQETTSCLVTHSVFVDMAKPLDLKLFYSGDRKYCSFWQEGAAQ